MNALLKLSGGIDAINRTIGRIFAWILLPMICLTAFEVFSRYILKSPTVWAWELIIQIWGLMLMACGGYCYWKGGLVRVDLLYNKFPAKVRYGINIATAILVLICMGLVFIYGMNIFLLSFRLNERISSVWGFSHVDHPVLGASWRRADVHSGHQRAHQECGRYGGQVRTHQQL